MAVIHAKLEVDDPTLGQQVCEFLRSHPKARVTFTSRSSGSGESTHATVTVKDGVFYVKESYGDKTPVGAVTLCEQVLVDWRKRTYERWVDGKGLVEVPPEKAFRTPRGKLGFYVKLSTPGDARASD